MKTKNLLFAAGLPIVLAACTNDEFTQNTSIGEDKLGKLIETPMLGVGVTDANTKAYVDRSWQWLPTTDANTGQVVDVDRIGLCWTGVNNGGDYAGPLAETGDMVYTNVKFEQVGWLYNGEDAPTMHCGILENGEYHNYVPELTPDANWNDLTSTWEAEKAGESLNYGRAMFKSGNGTIYEGEYIVYFPYNSSFWNAPVTAKQGRIMEFDVDQSDNKVKDSYQMVSKNAFNVGYVNSIEGGDEACMFGTYMLTSGIEFRVKGSGQIKEIVLWSKGEEAFKISQAISAKKVKEAIISGNGLSNAVYMDNAQINETSSTLVARVSDGGAMSLDNVAAQSVYVPFLPTSFADLHALIVAQDGTVANVTIGSVDFEARDFRPMSLDFGYDSNGKYVKRESNGDKFYFTAENYAYDEPSFVAAYKEALANAGNQANAPRTVTLLDNITLTKNQVGVYNEQSSYHVIIKSEPEDDVINTLTLSHAEDGSGVDYTFRTTDFNVNVVTNPQGCCNKNLVNLTLRGSTTGEGTNMTIYGGKLTLCEDIALKGNIYSKYEPTDEEGNEHPERVPEIIIASNSGGNAVVRAYAEFLNEGRMTINTKQKFYLVGANMTNSGSINVEGDGVSAENAEINMDESSVLTNKGDIYNMGDIDNDHGDFTNQADATFTDYVGSSLSGDRIVNEGGDFISEVNSVVRYNQAIDPNGVRPTTILRFVYGDEKNIGLGTFTTTYTLSPNSGEGIYVPYGGETLMKFESAIEDGETLCLNNDANNTAVKIGDFTVKSGMVTINHKFLTVDGDYKTDGACNTWMPEGLTVTGDMNLAKATRGPKNSSAKVRLAENKKLIVGGDLIVTDVTDGVTFNKGSKVEAANLIVAENQNVEFLANVVAHFDKEGEGVITNNGTIDITNQVSGSDSPAIVWCNSREGNGEYPNGRPQYHVD